MHFSPVRHSNLLNVLCAAASNKYKVCVFTGDKPKAGTDADVYINMIGEHGESGRKELNNMFSDDFERGKYEDHLF